MSSMQHPGALRSVCCFSLLFYGTTQRILQNAAQKRRSNKGVTRKSASPFISIPLFRRFLRKNSQTRRPLQMVTMQWSGSKYRSALYDLDSCNSSVYEGVPLRSTAPTTRRRLSDDPRGRRRDDGRAPEPTKRPSDESPSDQAPS